MSFVFMLLLFYAGLWHLISYAAKRQFIKRALCYVPKAFAGVLNYLLCRISALKILQHMSERSEFVLQNLWF